MQLGKSAPVEFFISNTDVETVEEDVKEAAKNLAKVEILEVEKKTKEGATYGSFRIKVEREDFGKCVSEDSWPNGWKVRRFFRNYRVKTDNKETAGEKIKSSSPIKVRTDEKNKEDISQKKKDNSSKVALEKVCRKTLHQISRKEEKKSKDREKLTDLLNGIKRFSTREGLNNYWISLNDIIEEDKISPYRFKIEVDERGMYYIKDKYQD